MEIKTIQKWITLIECDNQSTAHIIKATLESEGIHVNLKDENMGMFKSGLITVGVQVSSINLEKALSILVENGYLENQIEKKSNYLEYLDKSTSNIPLLKTLRPELRVLILIALFLFIVIFSSTLISINI